MGFTGAHTLFTFDVFILALYLLSHGCALLKYTYKHFISPSFGEKIAFEDGNVSKLPDYP